MTETFRHSVSLVGQVVEDLTYVPLSPNQFTATLVGVKKSPQYKQGGFFIFSNLRPGEYTLRVEGERFRPRQYAVTVPLEPSSLGSPPIFDLLPIFDQPGENELVVIVKNTNGGANRITFDPMILKKEIRAGALVLAPGFSARLAVELEVGEVRGASLDMVDGLATDSIVRIIRERSIRLKFDPYYLLPADLTQIIGSVVLRDAPGIPLEGVRVRLEQVNGLSVVLNDVAGATIATVGGGGTKVVLGTEMDVVTFTNHRGDYNFYFGPGQVFGNVTLEASLLGYLPQTKTITIIEKFRNLADFALFRP
jgi:hypothetical protein